MTNDERSIKELRHSLFVLFYDNSNLTVQEFPMYSALGKCDLIVITFTDERDAADVLDALRSMRRKRYFGLQDTVMVTKSRQGMVQPKRYAPLFCGSITSIGAVSPASRLSIDLSKP